MRISYVVDENETTKTVYGTKFVLDLFTSEEEEKFAANLFLKYARPNSYDLNFHDGRLIDIVMEFNGYDIFQENTLVDNIIGEIRSSGYPIS